MAYRSARSGSGAGGHPGQDLPAASPDEKTRPKTSSPGTCDLVQACSGRWGVLEGGRQCRQTKP